MEFDFIVLNILRGAPPPKIGKNSVYDFVRFLKPDLFSQIWTDVSKNSSKTAKNTEKWFSRNISGEMC